VKGSRNRYDNKSFELCCPGHWGGWTLYTYFQTRQQEAETAAIEARKPFEEKRLEFCEWATTYTSVIVSSDDETAVKNNTKAFLAVAVWTGRYGGR
jgi:hypothetical protein